MKRPYKQKNGFALAEVVIAFAVVTFCLTVALGLLAVGINRNRGTIGENAAESEAHAVYDDLVNAAQNGATPSFVFGISLPTLPAANATSTVTTALFFSDDGRHTLAGQPISSMAAGTVAKSRVTVIMSRSSLPIATSVRLWVTWPAEGDPNPAILPNHFTGSYEILTAINQ